MSFTYRLALAAIATCSAAPVARAASMECQGTIVAEGDSEQRLLDVCGDPTSRRGAQWRYEVEGSLPMVVTIGNGTVMFIRDADEVPDATGSPLGDRP